MTETYRAAPKDCQAGESAVKCFSQECNRD